MRPPECPARSLLTNSFACANREVFRAEEAERKRLREEERLAKKAAKAK